MKKQVFIDTIEAIRLQKKHDLECASKIGEIYDVFEANALYKTHWLENALIQLLQIEFDDNNEMSWIEYFLWELDFGKNTKLNATRKDGTKIDLSDSGKLYDYLVALNQIN